ncbi:ATP-binding protein [Candidatus Azambacteria bacterium]|nr:ATP-binding protein [Candidatus Azambacteria bacterium]
MTYIYRFQEKKLRELLKNPEIIAVTGPRQAGKTTLISHVLDTLPNSAYYTFDNIQMAKQFTDSPDAFFERYMQGKEIVFLDEIQYIPDGGKILKYLYDTKCSFVNNLQKSPKKGVKIIVSGSSAPEVSLQSLKYLVGRVSIIEVLPLSLSEYINYRDPKLFEMILAGQSVRVFTGDLQKFTSEYLIYGGYPRVAIGVTHDEKITVIQNIVQTLLLKEIRDLAGLADNDKLQKLIKSLVLMQGGLIEYKKLSELTGYSFDSVKKYITILEQTYIIHKAIPYFTNKLKEMVKSPKIYFFDLGIRNYLIDDFRGYDLRLDKGGMLEALMANHLQSRQKPLYFWRSKSGSEVDFIKILPENNIEIFECKWSFEALKQETITNIKKLYTISDSKIISFIPSTSKSSVAIWEVIN